MPEEIDYVSCVSAFHLCCPPDTKPLLKLGFLWRSNNETTLCRLPAMSFFSQSSDSILQNFVSLGEHLNQRWKGFCDAVWSLAVILLVVVQSKHSVVVAGDKTGFNNNNLK